MLPRKMKKPWLGPEVLCFRILFNRVSLCFAYLSPGLCSPLGFPFNPSSPVLVLHLGSILSLRAFSSRRKALRVEHKMEKSIKADDYPQPTVTREFSEDGKVEHGESGLNDPNHVELKRALKARHITMIGKCSSEP